MSVVTTSSTTSTTIDLLRHGECQGVSAPCGIGSDNNSQCSKKKCCLQKKCCLKKKYYWGRSDVALSQDGWQQMRDSLTQIRPAWHRIISSPLIRCADFAKELAQQRRLPLQFDRDLQELDFGDWDGKAIDQVWQEQREAVIAWGKDPVASPPPGGEAADHFYQRVTAVLMSLLERYRGEHLLLVCHGGVIKALLAHCLAMSLQAMHRLEVPYASLSRMQVIYDQGQYFFRLQAHNLHHSTITIDG